MASLMLLRTVDLDALASAAISSSRLVHCPSDNITEKITRITRSSAGVKMLKARCPVGESDAGQPCVDGSDGQKFSADGPEIWLKRTKVWHERTNPVTGSNLLKRCTAPWCGMSVSSNVGPTRRARRAELKFDALCQLGALARSGG